MLDVSRQYNGLKMLGTDHPMMQRHIPEEQRPELTCCESLKTHKKPPRVIPILRLPWLVFNAPNWLLELRHILLHTD
jgi:hypothetical protein